MRALVVRSSTALVFFVAISGVSCSLVSTPSEGRPGPCPTGMAHVAAADTAAHSFCVDKWEASVVEIRGREEVPHSPYEPVTNLKVKAVARAGVVPQGYISKNEAEAACNEARKRLCTGEEWQFTCRGKKPTTFPYGDEKKEGYCNDSGRAPIASLHPDLGEAVYGS